MKYCKREIYIILKVYKALVRDQTNPNTCLV